MEGEVLVGEPLVGEPLVGELLVGEEVLMGELSVQKESLGLREPAEQARQTGLKE